MTLDRHPLSIFCPRGTPPRAPVEVMNEKLVEPTNPESITNRRAFELVILETPLKSAVWLNRPHESTYANRINVIVNACSNFHLFGHGAVRSAHCYVTKR